MKKYDPEGILKFIEFGLARGIPDWVNTDWGLDVLHLGPGEKFIPGTHELDWPNWDGEEENCLRDFWDNSVGGIYATHFLEHLRDPRNVIAEASRVLAIGRPFNILVPHAKSSMYLQDLDHKTPFVLDTWKNLLDSSYYKKGKERFNFRIGANFLFALKEENVAVVTQLIKE